MSSSIVIRSVVKTDENKIKELFHTDVYHWSRWVEPVFRYGIVSLLAKPILLSIFGICSAGCYWGDVVLSLRLGSMLLGLLIILFVAKLLSFLHYFWFIPEFTENNLTELYSREGYAFIVAEARGQIVGCVGVQKAEDQVAKVFRMAVSSRCQGLGVGKQLLIAALHAAKDLGYSRVILQTSYNHQRAKRFYEKNSFVVDFIFYDWYYIPFYTYLFRFNGNLNDVPGRRTGATEGI